ncbi:MerR family transcriptional regulator [Cytobacillus sp. NCCP-133]|uniref:MerR family transcriptional regulator n=1 Tax=Cytobacillus sp. NCCP-133 TaxID=766848 RepID=UPI002232175A|nr:MerR family transcriptional regulator [Cytobacillus sp. NCCP-133]GLB59672.1 chromosome-anchoring protein RacA [Cytobacillus sp. NCCP-133]
MNTSAAAKLLGVSPSTIQRWVKQLELRTERNELGHYLFTEEDIELLRKVQDQLNQGMILQEVTVKGKKSRKGTVQSEQANPAIEKVLLKISELEQRLNGKADDVVSYQLLQHRREMEELHKENERLNKRIEALEAKLSAKSRTIPSDTLLVFDQEKPRKKLRKKNIFTMLFGL